MLPKIEISCNVQIDLVENLSYQIDSGTQWRAVGKNFGEAEVQAVR